MEGDTWRTVVTFVEPFLAHFRFRPSHVINIAMMKNEPPFVDRATKVSIVRLEHKGDMGRATTVYLNWLLGQLAEPDALPPFLNALRTDTREHKQVYRLLCVTSVYLDLHRPLLLHLARRLREGTVQLKVLLGLLVFLHLLDPERVPPILHMGQLGGSEEMFERAVTFLLISLYCKQAQILHEMSSNPNTARSGANPSTAETRLHRGSDVTAHANGDVTADVIHDSGGDSNPSDTASAAADEPQGASVAADPARCRWDSETLRSAVHERERWPELLNHALSVASTRESEWPYALCPQDHHRSFWVAAGLIQSGLTETRREEQGATADNGLIQSGLTETRREQGATADNGDTDSETGSGDSTGTVRAATIKNYNNLQRMKEERTKEYVKNVPVFNVIGHPGDDDDFSVSSIDTNPRQRARTGDIGGEGGEAGVLRKEELEALKGGDIKLRPYQEELLESARKGHNVLIWLPTGTGKTYIVLKYAEEHLKASPCARVAFVVPKVRLARQQYERFRAYLPQFHPHLKCGETSSTTSGRQRLDEVLKTSRVVVITGQSLVEAVERGRVELQQFSLLVLDECHHTRGGHPLRVLMNQYMECKFLREVCRLPQVMGLTASPGVGKARGKEVEEAVNYLKQLCARLDVSHICSVRKYQQDLQRFVHVPLPEVKECENRKVDRFQERLEVVMKAIEQNMILDCELEKHFNKVGKAQPQAEDDLLKKLKAPGSLRGKDQYNQWLSNAKKELQQVTYPKAFYALNARIDMLYLCQRCLILNEDCDSLDALQLLEDEAKVIFREKPRDSSDAFENAVDSELLQLFDEFTSELSTVQQPSVWADCRLPECENPKLKHLEEMLLSTSEDDPSGQGRKEDSSGAPSTRDCSLPDLWRQTQPGGPAPASGTDGDVGLVEGLEEEGSERNSTADVSELNDATFVTDSELEHLENKVRGMIFVRTLDLSKALVQWLKRHPKLKHLNPDRITGVNASVKNGGMTKREVTEVMSEFNGGTIRLVICTSAAEEGLDFKGCNFVVRYLYEASMVSMIQIRGRARDENSRYSVMGRQNTQSKEDANRQSELAMKEAVVSIQRSTDSDPRAHYDSIQKMQREAWNNRWSKDVDAKKRLQQRLPQGVYRLKCHSCRSPACTSEDIRLLRTTNRVVIGAEFSNKYERKDDQLSYGRTWDKQIPLTGTIHCKKCGARWGSLVRSVDNNLEFPVIPIKGFLIEDSSGKVNHVEKWSQAFDVPEISEEDRLRHSEPLLGPEDPLEGDVEPEVPEDDQGQELEGQRGGRSLDPLNPLGGDVEPEEQEEDEGPSSQSGEPFLDPRDRPGEGFRTGQRGGHQENSAASNNLGSPPRLSFQLERPGAQPH